MSIVTTIIDEVGKVRFRVFTHEVADVSLNRVICDPVRAAGFFKSVREDALSSAVHVLWSASTGQFTLPQIHHCDDATASWSPDMDLLTAFRTAEAVETAKRPARDVVYVAPLPTSGVPDDGMLKYSTVSELKDLFGGIEPGHCFLFSDDADSLAVLKVINDHPNILPFGARRLEGLVAVEYPASFLRDSWALESEQYHTILSQKAERKHEEASAKKEEAVKSTFHREQQARTRLSGNQRRHTAFDVVRAEAPTEDPDVGAVEE